jgi:L-iditol 2-dehydrogenase
VKAFVADGEGASGVREVLEPFVGAEDVLVTPLVVGLCGTDLELIDATIDPAFVRYPLVLGHEWVGRLEDDDCVVVEGIVPDGACDACLRGDTNLCAVYDEIGFTRPGAFAEQVSVPRSLVHRLEPTVAIDDAVLVEPMAVVWRALTRVTLRHRLRVAVIGDGTVALLAALLVQQFWPSSTTVIGRREEQRELARVAGADEFFTTEPTSEFDLVIEAAGTVEAVGAALGHCARGGMVILLGLPPHGSTIEFAPDDLVNNDQIVQGSFSYTRQSFAEIVDQLNAGTLQPGFLITHRFTLDGADAAVATLRGGSTQQPRGKVVVDIQP